VDDVVVGQLAGTIDLVRRIVGQFHPEAAVVPFEAFAFVDAQDGFGLTLGDGVSLVRGDVDGYGPSTWNLQFTSAIAFDVPHRYEVEEWVNLQNRTTVLGRYYCAISPDRRISGIVWETHVWSRLLEDIGGVAGQGVVQWVAQIVRECLETSSTEAQSFTRRFGGRLLAPTDADMIRLYVTSDGGSQA
jgi:hypothetical protein